MIPVEELREVVDNELDDEVIVDKELEDEVIAEDEL